jgi:hypothetical protein
MAPPPAPVPVLHGSPLFQAIRNLASRSLADAEKNGDIYSAAYRKQIQKLIDQCDAAGAVSPKEQLQQAADADEAAFSDPRHRTLLRQTTAGRAVDDQRHGRG